MKPPYFCRICTAVGDCVFELVRFTKRHPCASDWDYWMNGREGRCWVETPISDSKCVSRRWQPPMSDSTMYMRMRRSRNGQFHG